MSEHYEIIVQGHIDQSWLAEWAAELVATPQESGNTLIAGPIADQAALHGLLKKIRNLGLPLLLVQRMEPHIAADNGPEVETE
ncbi:MAG: hypothetical protein FOGNACKC_03293 [Anaerolineae bacterium]|nr:hypothetical protein [Anaerolineae bacterium]